MTRSNDYAVSVRHTSPRTIAAVHARVPVGGVGGAFRQHLDQVYAAARAGALHLDGQNVFLYRPVTGESAQLDVAFGVGTTSSFSPVGAVVPTPLPVGEAASTTHWGSYAALGRAHAAIADWCRANGRQCAGPSWEVYGHWTDDESQLRTDVYYLLAAK